MGSKERELFDDVGLEVVADVDVEVAAGLHLDLAPGRCRCLPQRRFRWVIGSVSHTTNWMPAEVRIECWAAFRVVVSVPFWRALSVAPVPGWVDLRAERRSAMLAITGCFRPCGLASRNLTASVSRQLGSAK